MIGALLGQGYQYLEAKLFKTKDNNETGRYFRYEEMNYQNRSFGEVINNLIATQGRYVIKTNWDLGFEPGQFIIDKKTKRMWTIEEVQQMPQEVNSQVLYWCGSNPDTDYVLSLVEIENAWGLE